MKLMLVLVLQGLLVALPSFCRASNVELPEDDDGVPFDREISEYKAVYCQDAFAPGDAEQVCTAVEPLRKFPETKQVEIVNLRQGLKQKIAYEQLDKLVRMRADGISVGDYVLLSGRYADSYLKSTNESFFQSNNLKPELHRCIVTRIVKSENSIQTSCRDFKNSPSSIFMTSNKLMKLRGDGGGDAVVKMPLPPKNSPPSKDLFVSKCGVNSYGFQRQCGRGVEASTTLHWECYDGKSGDSTLPGCGDRVNDALLRKSADACAKNCSSSNGGPDRSVEEQLRAQGLRFAQCMRTHGVALPDPDSSGRIPEPGSVGIDQGSPQFQAANQACGTDRPPYLPSNAAYNAWAQTHGS